MRSNTLDPIEGIYKVYQTGNITYYKFGIIKHDNKFKAIIIESDLKQWKQGEVKAIFEQSSMRGFYSVRWYMADKTPQETFGSITNNALLSIELKNPKTGEKEEDKFIKMYPQETQNASINSDNSKASGSGFFYFHKRYHCN